jgi:hypothetical protein
MGIGSDGPYVGALATSFAGYKYCTLAFGRGTLSGFHLGISPVTKRQVFKGIYQLHTLWLFNIAMENGPFIDGLPGFTF